MTTDAAAGSDISLALWAPGDLAVLERSNSPEMMVFLGGPETQQQLAARHERYLRLVASGEAQMFRIELGGPGHPVGAVGYWKTEWEGAPVYETGWNIHSPFQGRGIAKRAVVLALQHAAAHGDGDRSLVLAFPRIDNSASNALCRSIGFEFRGEQGFEYPKGHPIRVNAFAYDLARLRTSA
ncbi:GNAT family N-acetyltransferase [Glaciihabitans sp. dw_435]|uniref:GNAT family N-acetyltransferase n=1 Tax=Glaciihabitans sp. dw_435 TaxID=2720081 RepID=UPI001BD349D7|nr:GNAT family N-acetyltransferase [Glaciihabitans sp. dw_435]